VRKRVFCDEIRSPRRLELTSFRFFSVPQVNALPEKSWAVVNHRINVASSPQQLRERFISVIAPKAKSLNLTLTAWGEDIIEGSSVGHIVLENAFQDW